MISKLQLFLILISLEDRNDARRANQAYFDSDWKFVITLYICRVVQIGMGKSLLRLYDKHRFVATIHRNVWSWCNEIHTHLLSFREHKCARHH